MRCHKPQLFESVGYPSTSILITQQHWISSSFMWTLFSLSTSAVTSSFCWHSFFICPNTFHATALVFDILIHHIAPIFLNPMFEISHADTLSLYLLVILLCLINQFPDVWNWKICCCHAKHGTKPLPHCIRLNLIQVHWDILMFSIKDRCRWPFIIHFSRLFSNFWFCVTVFYVKKYLRIVIVMNLTMPSLWLPVVLNFLTFSTTMTFLSFFTHL